MSRRCVSLVSWFLVPLASAAPGGATERPNVIVVMTDDQGFGDLACHGNPVLKTPNLDALHAQSVRLTEFHVDPACAPTRAALMTGRYSHRAGVWHVVMGRTLLHPDEVTMAEVFRDAGYRTAIFGKWHLGDNYPFRPQDQGFEEVLIHGGGVIGHTPDHWMNDYFDDTYLHNGRWEPVKGYCTDVWFHRAMAFMRLDPGRPFFVYLPLNAPHQPFQVPERFEAMYRDREDVPVPAFYGMIASIDENMGHLMRMLDETRLAKNTILIFLTDNGTSGGVRRPKGRDPIGFDGGMRGAKASPYEGGHRVPCFIRWPGGGLEGGRDVGGLTAHFDMLPTLIDLCGIPAPRDIRFDGISLAAAMRAERPVPARTLVAELQLVVGQPERSQRTSVMSGPWRLVNGTELYDLRADPLQITDVATRNPDEVRRLREAYDRWWDDVSENHARDCEIVLGSERENPTRLTAYHWNNATGEQRDMPWAHAHIVAGSLQNGWWRVLVERAGHYAFRLRRWPAETGLAINTVAHFDPPEKSWHPITPGTLNATRARLRIGEYDQTLPVPPGAEAVTFTTELHPGSARLQTWFLDDAGNSRGAYYVEVERQE